MVVSAFDGEVIDMVVSAFDGDDSLKVSTASKLNLYNNQGCIHCP